jgi:hypothetical protein
MREQEGLSRPIEEIEMRTSTTGTYTPRYRSVFTSLLITLCIPIFFYQLVPAFTQATGDTVNTFTSKFLQQSSCTKDIGDAQCCNLYLDAAPCQDECRKQYVDRETFKLTLQYDECADECVAVYNRACKRIEDGFPISRSTENDA